jgi:eukaryotic-like serine/threonine-protein kinase
MALSPGTKLGPYEIVAPAGAGGMGEVYRARDARLHREVAIKVLPAAFSRDPDRLSRFQQEARAVASFNHPNIMALHDFGEHQDSPYIVAELLEGEILRDRMRSGRCRYARQPITRNRLRAAWRQPMKRA